MPQSAPIVSKSPGHLLRGGGRRLGEMALIANAAPAEVMTLAAAVRGVSIFFWRGPVAPLLRLTIQVEPEGEYYCGRQSHDHKNLICTLTVASKDWPLELRRENTFFGFY